MLNKLTIGNITKYKHPLIDKINLYGNANSDGKLIIGILIYLNDGNKNWIEGDKEDDVINEFKEYIEFIETC